MGFFFLTILEEVNIMVYGVSFLHIVSVNTCWMIKRKHLSCWLLSVSYDLLRIISLISCVQKIKYNNTFGFRRCLFNGMDGKISRFFPFKRPCSFAVSNYAKIKRPLRFCIANDMNVTPDENVNKQWLSFHFQAKNSRNKYFFCK